MSGTAAAERTPRTVEELAGEVGREIGLSPWRIVTQGEIDRFAEVTDDRQFIHVDPVRAERDSAFGGTIAHGFLTLSLLSSLGREALPALAGRDVGVNYGLDRVRFVSPVRSGARVRGRFVLRELRRRAEREVLLRYGVTVEIEGVERPALVAEWLTLAILGEGAGRIRPSEAVPAVAERP